MADVSKLVTLTDDPLLPTTHALVERNYPPSPFPHFFNFLFTNIVVIFNNKFFIISALFP